MWTCTTEPLADGRSFRCLPLRDGSPITFADAIDGWRANMDFRNTLNGWLAGTPLASFRWETPPITAATVHRPFEFVLWDAPGLEPKADRRPFERYFRSYPNSDAFAVRNLGGDAVLVIPCPVGPPDTYAHLATFVRRASSAQRHAFWLQVGRTVWECLNDRPLWLSTAGMGVQWLHVRIDDRPKYYGHAPYRVPPQPPST